MQIGVGLDAGAVRTRSKPSQVSPVVCVYIYVMCTRVHHFIRVYCAEGLHFSAFILRFSTCAFLIGIECSCCELTHCVTCLSFMREKQQYGREMIHAGHLHHLCFAGVICGSVQLR